MKYSRCLKKCFKERSCRWWELHPHHLFASMELTHVFCKDNITAKMMFVSKGLFLKLEMNSCTTVLHQTRQIKVRHHPCMLLTLCFKSRRGHKGFFCEEKYIFKTGWLWFIYVLCFQNQHASWYLTVLFYCFRCVIARLWQWQVYVSLPFSGWGVLRDSSWGHPVCGERCGRLHLLLRPSQAR